MSFSTIFHLENCKLREKTTVELFFLSTRLISNYQLISRFLVGAFLFIKEPDYNSHSFSLSSRQTRSEEIFLVCSTKQIPPKPHLIPQKRI